MMFRSISSLLTDYRRAREEIHCFNEFANRAKNEGNKKVHTLEDRQVKKQKQNPTKQPKVKPLDQVENKVEAIFETSNEKAVLAESTESKYETHQSSAEGGAVSTALTMQIRRLCV